MKIRGVAARKGDTPAYVNKMQQEVLAVLAEARSLEDLRRIEPKAREVYRRYMDELDGADVKELAIHRRVSRLNYSRLNKCIYPIRKRESKSIRNAKVLQGCRSIPPFLGFNEQAV